MAQVFAAERGRLEGDAAPVASGATAPQPVNGAVLSAASSDLLTYGGGTTPERLLWLSRAGTRSLPPWTCPRFFTIRHLSVGQ